MQTGSLSIAQQAEQVEVTEGCCAQAHLAQQHALKAWAVKQLRRTEQQAALAGAEAKTDAAAGQA